MYFIFSYIDVFCVYFVGSQHQNSQIFEYLLKIIWHQRMFFSPNTQIIGGNRLIGHGVSSMKKLQLLEIVANQKYSRASRNIDGLLVNEEAHDESPNVIKRCH